jgi:undecaprenyl-diphosphatase
LAGASVLNLKDIIGQSFEINYLVFIAITLSFLFSYFTVKFFLKYINKFSLNIFIIYRVIVGIILLLIIYN